MRAYVFHHVTHGGPPLSGEALVEEVVATATTLPGYREYCGHQYEIHQRATEWARCIENSHYFPYGTQRGKYKAKTDPVAAESGRVERTWNEQRSQTAQNKIQCAVADLLDTGQFPETATARFKKLADYGIGGGTLYKYKALWHPDLWKSPQTPQTSNQGEAFAMAAPAAASSPTSLLPSNDSNALLEAGSSTSEGGAEASEVRNPTSAPTWEQLMQALKERRSQQQQEARSKTAAFLQSKAQQSAQSQAEEMLEYLQSGDPILVKEGVQWMLRQERPRLQRWRLEACGQPLSDVLFEVGKSLNVASPDAWVDAVRRVLANCEKGLG
jgi:hypothetical protein